MSVADQAEDVVRRKRVRWTAILFGLIAAAFYFGFIVMAVIRSRS